MPKNGKTSNAEGEPSSTSKTNAGDEGATATEDIPSLDLDGPGISFDEHLDEIPMGIPDGSDKPATPFKASVAFPVPIPQVESSIVTPIDPPLPMVEIPSSLVVLPTQPAGPEISLLPHTPVRPTASTSTPPLLPAVPIEPDVQPTTGAQASSSTAISLEPVVTRSSASPSRSHTRPPSQRLAAKKVPNNSSSSKEKGKGKAKFQDDTVDGPTAFVSVPRVNKRKAQTPDGSETCESLVISVYRSP